MAVNYASILLFSAVIAVIANQVESLKCWRCSSDASGGAFCQDPFDSKIISDQQYKWSYVDCNFPASQQQSYNLNLNSQSTRPVCKKIKQIIQSLRCWRCSSDASSAQFCQDPFDPTLISDQQRRWSYVDCGYQPNQGNSYSRNPYSEGNTRPVCKKIKQIINGREVVSRSCAWEDFNSAADECLRQGTPSYIRTEFCETCNYDGCNGAYRYNSIGTFGLLGVVIITKLLSLLH